MKRYWTFGDYRKLDFWLVVLILGCAFAKALLVGKGMLAFPDESRVFASANLLQSLADGNLSQAITDIFSTKGRPGAVVLNILPVAIQYGLGKAFGLSTFESVNTWPFFLVNLAVYLGILWIIFKLGIVLLRDRTASLVGVLLYVCLINGYIYLRHTLPYDKSLLIFLVLIYQILKADGVYSQKRILGMGALAFFGFLVYPGYILLYGVTSVFFFFFGLKRNAILLKIKQGLLFALGGGVVFAITEAISRVGAISYWGISSHLSETIVQGDFSESFSFLFSYLYDVEGILGILLCAGLLWFITKVLLHKSHRQSVFFLLLGTVVMFWLLYACAGYFFHKVTFYGRLIHQFMPFLCIAAGSAFVFNVNKQFTMVKKLAVVIVAGIAMVVFGIQFNDYLRHDYPKDVAWSFDKQYPDTVFTEHCELGESWSSLRYYNEQHPDVSVSDEFHIVNACFFYPVLPLGEKMDYQPAEPHDLLVDKSYFQNFPAYQFEGLSPEERSNMRNLDLRIKIYHLFEK